MKDDVFFRKLEQSLMKRAMGYNCKETTTEYAFDHENESKKKVVKIKTVEKYVPPDVSALKALAELQSGKLITDAAFNPEHMSDEQLQAETERLTKMIKQEKHKQNEVKNAQNKN